MSEITSSYGKIGGIGKKGFSPRALLCALVLVGFLCPGIQVMAAGENAIEQGTGSSATGKEDIAIGKGANAASTALSTDNTGNNIAVGSNAAATGPYHDIAIGSSANVEGSSYGIAMGHAAHVGGPTANQAIGSIAIGGNSDVTNRHGVAIGDQSKVSGLRGVSIGMVSHADGEASAALGMWAKAKNNYSVALGSYSDTANVVSTPSGIINGRNYNFAGGTALGTVSVGKTGAKEADPGDNAITDQDPFVRTITNVGAGRISANSTDAVNGSQLFAVADALSRVSGNHYYSVNSMVTGTDSNYNNDGATGTDSLAAGVKAKAAGSYSTAVGNDSEAAKDSAVALGGGAKAYGNYSIAIGNDSKAHENNRTSGSAVAIGSGSRADAEAAVSLGNDAKATNNYATAVGYGTNATAQDSSAFGVRATASGGASLAMGNDAASSGENAIAMGNNASVTAKNGMALGSNTKVANENAVAIGAGSETAAAVATPSATINGTAHNFAGVNPASTVSVGKAGSERTITNVAAGRISAVSTDAINGSQLFAVTSEMDKGVVYAGDVKGAGAADNKFTQKLGEQTNIVGGVADTAKLTDGNIGVVSNGTNTLNIKLAKDVKVDSVTTGNTVINNNGLTVGGNTYVTNNGINANNQKVTNVADGQVAAGSKDAVNGGQLNDVKNEVINKGLRFDADNNSEKTNKLGSKVTVNGDNNITTEITQTGDDTKIGVKLNKDINVKTVTATDTVKAGGVTMGGQTVANAAGANETGNYVTGLDNKTWNIQNPNIVSGRGATEDQLKIVSDEVKKQGANATDYRLVKNASSADGSYTVDTNGDIDLTVEDKNHAGQKETVKLKDIASKSKLDDVINKGLQFDANVGGVQTNKLGSKITIKGEGTGADNDYSGENLKTFITQDPAGNTTIDVKMNKNLKVETVVATGENGKDGKIGINGKDGVTTNISVTRDGKPGVDGAPGTTTTRIVYEKPDGTKEEVATLNDGMKYGGDTGAVIKKKLNEQVNVIGGITDATKLTADDNIGVVSDGSNNLKVRLAKALKGLESVTTGDTVMNNNGVTINNGAAGNTVSLTKDGLDNGGNKITNVAAGDVSANSTDAVNGSQLHEVKTLAGQHTTVKAKDTNVTVTEGTNAAGGKEYTVGLGDKVTLGSDPSKQVSIDGTTGIIKAGDKVTIDGTTGNIDAGKVKINGKDGTVNELTNKTWDPNNITSGQAATEDQLKAVDQKITNTSEELTKKGMDFAGNDGEFHRNLGDKVTIKGEGTKAASEYSGENIKTFADTNGNVVVKMDKNLKTDSVAINGQNGQDGATIKGGTGKAGVDGTNITRLVIEEKDGTKHDIATLDDGMKYGGDTGTVIKKKLDEQVNVIGGITDETKLTTEDNLGVVSDGSNNLKVRMAKDLKGLNNVTTNTLTVGDVKIDNSGINAGNKKVTNVFAGDVSSSSTDAVNGAQLYQTNQSINNIGGAINKLGDRVDRVGAGAAALAALHPLDFDPDDKWDVAAGYGNYKDAHAVSVGAFYRPNEDTMFSVGGSFGGGENMVNAGVSVKLGQGNHVSTSKVAMAKEIVDLKDAVTRLEAQNEQFRQIIGQMAGQPVRNVAFPDVPKDHWAYSYVKSLADRGLLEGYPDGEFKGDRSMTRYEFAAIIYRALQNGAPVDGNMGKAMEEFGPEMEKVREAYRFRVDRISGEDNDRNKVERVRVNNEGNKEKGDCRDIYGSHIAAGK